MEGFATDFPVDNKIYMGEVKFFDATKVCSAIHFYFSCCPPPLSLSLSLSLPSSNAPKTEDGIPPSKPPDEIATHYHHHHHQQQLSS
jgi:hypothetical protein